MDGGLKELMWFCFEEVLTAVKCLEKRLFGSHDS